MSETIRKLAQRVLRAEIVARRPKDASVVEDVLSPRLRLDPNTGDFYVTKLDGQRDDSKTLESLLAEVVSVRPELFEAQPLKAAGQNENPFVQGPAHNVTAQMILMKTDPVRADKLMDEADFKRI